MAFRGINIATQRGAANKPVIGFRGITVGLLLNLPISVIDQRGRGIANVQVRISNPTSGVPFTAITDSLGNCLVNADASNPNPVTVTLGKIVVNRQYTGGSTFQIVVESLTWPLE